MGMERNQLNPQLHQLIKKIIRLVISHIAQVTRNYALAIQFRCFIINALSLCNEKPSFFYDSERVFLFRELLGAKLMRQTVKNGGDIGGINFPAISNSGIF